jgi:Tfp pilus assembly pilus retraction ATPase PilT
VACLFPSKQGGYVDSRASNRYCQPPTANCFSCYAAQNFNIVIRGRAVLVELRLENYAVIDNAAVEFASGLNLLTGETGAGKSILIDALALLLGEKASTDVIRAGA